MINLTDHNNVKEKQRPANSSYPKGGVSCSKDSFVVNQTLVFHPENIRDKFCGKSLAHRQSANRV